MPGVYDYPRQEQEQYDDYFVANPALLFIETARQQIEEAAGGGGTWNVGVDYAKLLANSSYKPEVEALYQKRRRLHPVLARAAVGRQRPLAPVRRGHALGTIVGAEASATAGQYGVPTPLPPPARTGRLHTGSR
jgi:hypothetical protein